MTLDDKILIALFALRLFPIEYLYYKRMKSIE
jgi:hypothetical protein